VLATVRDTIMYADLTHFTLLNLSLYFIAAFDRISHTYLLRMLKYYCYGLKFITHIQSMWYKTYFSVNLMATLQEPLPHNVPFYKAVQ